MRLFKNLFTVPETGRLKSFMRLLFYCEIILDVIFKGCNLGVWLSKTYMLLIERNVFIKL